MITEKKLQSIYFTEVTKKNILGGLDKLAGRYKKVYCVVFDGGAVQPIIAPLFEVISKLQELINLDDDDKEDLIKDILNDNSWSWNGFIEPNGVEVIVTINSENMLKHINWRLKALQEAQTKVANG